MEKWKAPTERNEVYVHENGLTSTNPRPNGAEFPDSTDMLYIYIPIYMHLAI